MSDNKLQNLDAISGLQEISDEVAASCSGGGTQQEMNSMLQYQQTMLKYLVM